MAINDFWIAHQRCLRASKQRLKLALSMIALFAFFYSSAFYDTIPNGTGQPASWSSTLREATSRHFSASNKPSAKTRSYQQVLLPYACETTEDPNRTKAYSSTTSLEDVLPSLFKDRLHAVDDRNYTAEDGTQHDFTGEAIWSATLGKELCIFDTDNRKFSEAGQPFNREHFTFDSLKDSSAGIFNHYLYAMIHGYRYHYLVAPPYASGRGVFWSKIPALSDMLLDGCRIAIAIDHDAFFWNLNLPFEWLMNRWNFTKHTSFGMALDNNWQQNHDEHDKLNINAGFIIAQNLPRTHDILRAWDSCPSNTTIYPNCRKYMWGWPAEQGAWGTHIRYQFNDANDRLEIPCNDANGFPGMGTECFGVFIRHFTIGKDRVNGAAASTLSQMLYSLLRDTMVRNEDQVRIIRKSNDFEQSFSYVGGGEHGDPISKEDLEKQEKEEAEKKKIKEAEEEEKKKEVEEEQRKKKEEEAEEDEKKGRETPKDKSEEKRR